MTLSSYCLPGTKSSRLTDYRKEPVRCDAQETCSCRRQHQLSVYLYVSVCVCQSFCCSTVWCQKFALLGAAIQCLRASSNDGVTAFNEPLNKAMRSYQATYPSPLLTLCCANRWRKSTRPATVHDNANLKCAGGDVPIKAWLGLGRQNPSNNHVMRDAQCLSVGVID